MFEEFERVKVGAEENVLTDIIAICRVAELAVDAVEQDLTIIGASGNLRSIVGDVAGRLSAIYQELEEVMP